MCQLFHTQLAIKMERDTDLDLKVFWGYLALAPLARKNSKEDLAISF